MQLALMVLFGVLGGSFFIWLKIPGGGIIGSAVAVIIYAYFAHTNGTVIPHLPPMVTNTINIAMGIVIGSFFMPEQLDILVHHWREVILSAVVLITSGCLTAILLYKTGFLSMGAAYLASSPGGLSAVVGIASDMNPKETPLVLLCQMVRLYAILLSAPIISKLLSWWFKV